MFPWESLRSLGLWNITTNCGASKASVTTDECRSGEPGRSTELRDPGGGAVGFPPRSGDPFNGTAATVPYRQFPVTAIPQFRSGVDLSRRSHKGRNNI